jgi:hypothetical protein
MPSQLAAGRAGPMGNSLELQGPFVLYELMGLFRRPRSKFLYCARLVLLETDSLWRLLD